MKKIITDNQTQSYDYDFYVLTKNGGRGDLNIGSHPWENHVMPLSQKTPGKWQIQNYGI